jgi:hypothetical protein
VSPRRAPIPARVRREVLAEALCHYCRGLWPNEVDHVQPVSRGGTDDRENLVAACHRCNWEKLDFTPEEWRAWRLETGRPWPPAPWHTALSNVLTALDEATLQLGTALVAAGDPAYMAALTRIANEHHNGSGRPVADDAARLAVLIRTADAA